jgi:hypothetical protein
MNEQNKHNMSRGLELLLIFIWAILTAATCAMIWNFIPTILNSLVALGLFSFNAVAIIRQIRDFNRRA